MPRLRIRILLFVVALLLGVLLPLVALLHGAGLAEAERQRDARLELAAEEWRATLHRRAQEQQRLLDALAAGLPADDIDAEALTEARDRLRDRLGAHALARLDSGGRTVWSSLGDAPAPEWSRLPPGLSEASWRVQNNALWLVAQLPLAAADGGGRLLLATLIDDAWLQDHWGRRGGVAALYVDEGVAAGLLASGLDAAGREDWTRWRSGKSTRLLWREVVIDGADRGLHAALALPLPERLASRPLLLWQLAAMGLLALLIAAAGAWWIGDSISRPLSAMVRHMRQIGRGEAGDPLPVERRGEIGALAREFAYMLSALAQRESSIRHLAFHDALTGLLNRNRFSELIEDALLRGVDHRFGVLVLDINRFRDINDTLGHVAGDRILKEVASRLAHRCRAEDRVARLSGDQFGVLLGSLPPIEVVALMQRYREAFAEPFSLDEVSLDLAPSMGLAVHPEHGQRAGVLLQRAEIAMYLAKSRRVGSMLYTPELDRHSVLRLTLMAELRAAIDRGQIELHVQPKLDIRGWRIIGVECLVRWVHPEHGFVPPDEFIPLAEQTGNIRRLTGWMIETALDWAVRWRAAGKFLRVAVNISTIDLQDPTFPHRIAALLAERSLPFEWLLLEVTESVLMDDPERALPVLAQLRDMGVGLSIDDFGTGYSSMAQLKRLPVEELKIDKSFVFDVTGNPDDAVIVRSIIEIGHNMELRVVAEGVENEACLQYLSRFGCDVAQGYFLSRPMPAAELLDWLERSPYLVSGEEAQGG